MQFHVKNTKRALTANAEAAREESAEGCSKIAIEERVGRTAPATCILAGPHGCRLAGIAVATRRRMNGPDVPPETKWCSQRRPRRRLIVHIDGRQGARGNARHAPSYRIDFDSFLRQHHLFGPNGARLANCLAVQALRELSP